MDILSFISKRSGWLEKHLKQALKGSVLSYDDIRKIDSVGLYFIFTEDSAGIPGFQYIGQTTRSAKRMRELASGYRSHTFNRKLLAQRFRENDIVVDVLSNNIKKRWAESKIMSVEDFQRHQQGVNELVKIKFKYRFYEYRYTDILAFEHYAIAILGPLYND